MAVSRWPGILIGFGILIPTLAAGQPASLVLDINSTGRGPGSEDRIFYDLRKAGDRLYFGGGGSTGQELWVSDGTSAGTEVVRDLCPGSCFTAPKLLGALGKLMIWTDRSGIWRSDGTRPGTFRLTEPHLNPAPQDENGSSPHAFLGRWFYFSACSGFGQERDCDLWRTDGSVAGTLLFHEAPGDFLWLAVAGGRLYYLATDDQGSDLWVTDGTAAGTVLLRRFEGFHDHPQAQVAAGDRLFFVAVDGDTHQVWTSDGTVAGTRPVTSLPRDRPYASQDLGWLKPVGSRVYFPADDGTHHIELWRTDGTAAGTSRLTDLAVGNPILEPEFLADLGGIVVFRAVLDFQVPDRLWTTRGTPGSTAPLLDLCEDCHFLFPRGLVESGGKAFFLVRQDSQIDLWFTDGTSSGTRRLKNLCQSCSVGQLISWKGGVLFSSYQVKDLWISDGTTAGTRPFTNLVGAAVFPTTSGVAEIGGGVYLLARGEQPGLWVRDQEGKTRPVYVLPAPEPGSNPQNLSESGGKLLFTAEDGQTLGLWSSGGTQESTVPVPVPGLDWSEASDFTRAADVVFFQVGNGNGDRDLWRTDGTVQGTVKLAHLPHPAALVPFQGALYAFSGREVWRSSGTVAGTVKTGDLPPNVTLVYTATSGPNGIYLKLLASNRAELWFMNGSPGGAHRFLDSDVGGEDPRFTAVGAWMYFTFNLRLWRTDGTAGGTALVEGLPDVNFLKLVSNQGALYFATVRGTRQLWRTDDTTADLIAEFPVQTGYGFLFNLTPFNGKIFFSAADEVHGIELWATDGTPAGTGLVRDLMPGPISSFPSGFTVADGRLFFAAGDDLHGIELWQSDGTEAGTHMVQDIAPQAESSSPEQLTPVGDRLFFTADDGITGREVWVLPLSGPSSCKPSTTRLCLGNGRYAVEAVWRDFQGNRGIGHAAPLTADTGTFWFFNPENVEVVLKVLDGRGLNDHVWVFYGALSNVEYTLTVTDTQTGLSHRYINPSGQLASVADTKAFGPLGATAESVASASPLPLVERKIGPATAVCAPSSTRLCLNGDRFAVEISWKDFEGKTGVGKAVEMTGGTGYFWFFNESNVEVVLKVLDGRPVNGHHWVFYGALSSVEYTITVTDTQTGEINTYRNPSGRLASVADTGAF